MLDTGIDVPEVLNLVFFKKVMSKAKFWQMIGCGTRLCPGLLDGEDKQKFYIFDFCGNFEFFRMGKEKPTANMLALQGAIFNLEFQMAYKLQDINYQGERLIEYRKALVDTLTQKVQELGREGFAVRQHIKYVDLYSSGDNYNSLTYEDTLVVREELAPLILPDGDDANAVRFDALMYGIELTYLDEKKYTRARSDLLKRVSAVAGVANIPEIQMQAELINKILHTDYVGTNLDSRQIYFVNQIVEYIVQNGIMKDLSMLQETPFTDKGSVVEIFTDMKVWVGIRKVIEQINANAAA